VAAIAAGETAGAFGLELNPRALAKLGYLYLNQGVWEGRQIVPADWIATSTTQHSSGASPAGVNPGQAGYGYLWWVTEVAGYPAYFALGYGSQMMYVVPRLDLIAVALVAEPNVELQQNPKPLIEQLIVPAALAGPSLPAATEPAGVETTAVAQTAQGTPLPQALAAATPTGGGHLFALPDARVFPMGIAYDQESGDFYAGSVIDGTIFRGNVETGAVDVFLPGRPELVATGLALDGRGHRFVAGGQTGFVAVYDLASRERIVDVGNGLAPNTFLNDVAVTPDGNAYFTDSFNPILWRLPASALPAGIGASIAGASLVAAPVSGALEAFLDLSAVPGSPFGPGFNASGIVSTPDGQALLVIQSNTGSLYHFDVASGDVTPVNLGGETLPGGSGLALDGQTLYVVTGESITTVEMAGDYLNGTVGQSLSDPTFAAPSALARFDGCLLVVNSQRDQLEGQPTLPFRVSSVPLPGSSGTPVAAGRC
jgi:Cu-Zn family superoxide dismutase